MPLSLVDIFLVCANLCLLIVFGLAAVAKLRDSERAHEGLAGFGVPRSWTRPALVSLVLAELLVAALLALPAARSAGAAAALGMLALFTLAIGWHLLRGQRPACACFGALSPSAISWRSIARNLVLIALAGALLVLPHAGPALPPRAGVSIPALVAAVWAAICTAWLVLLTRQNGRLLLRIQQLEQGPPPGGAATPVGAGPLQPGAAVPPLGLSDVRGRPFDLGSLRGTPVLLLFLDAACSHCRPLLARLRELQPPGAALAVISENPELQRELPPEIRLLVDAGRRSAALFGVRGTPAAVHVDAGGALAQPVVHGTAGVGAALDHLYTPEAHREWAPV